MEPNVMEPNVFKTLDPELSQAYVEYLQLELRLIRLLDENPDLRQLILMRHPSFGEVKTSRHSNFWGFER